MNIEYTEPKKSKELEIPETSRKEEIPVSQEPQQSIESSTEIAETKADGLGISICSVLFERSDL